MATAALSAQISVNGTRVDHASIWLLTGSLVGGKTLLVTCVKNLSADDEITAEIYPDGSGTWTGNASVSKLTAIKMAKDPA